jgi:hypothetical protein
MGKLFGDEVAVYEADLHVDHNTHELIVNDHGQSSSWVATEGPGLSASEDDVEKATLGRVSDPTRESEERL